MRLPGDTEIHGTSAPLGCKVRRLRLRRGQCRGFPNVRPWAEGSHTANLLLAHPTDLAVEEPWYLIRWPSVSTCIPRGSKNAC